MRTAANQKTANQSAEHAIRDINTLRSKLDKVSTFLARYPGAEVCLPDRMECIETRIYEREHCWFFANTCGSYLLACNEGNASDAIEAFGEYFIDSGYEGLYCEPEAIAHLAECDYEGYYPYNGGELYIEEPAILEQLY